MILKKNEQRKIESYEFFLNYKWHTEKNFIFMHSRKLHPTEYVYFLTKICYV